MQPIQYLDYKIALHQLRHQAVRDLAWCCFSAPMMNELPGSALGIFPLDNRPLWQWLQMLDQQPQPLLDHLNQRKSTRLGIYYEALWHFYFANHPEWELLHHNLQIDRNGITLGAFDFLCRHNNEYWHIETAVKFYLCSTNNPLEAHDWKYWIGPEGKDRLDLKLNHLRQHQLPLHKRPEAELQLIKLYPQVTMWNTGLCIQGYLFSPAQNKSSPAFAHPQHGHGSWWFASEFLQDVSSQFDQYWLVLERQQWLSPAQCSGAHELLTTEQLATKLLEDIEQTHKPLLIAAMALGEHLLAADEKAALWIESARMFIVPDDWPNDYSSTRPGNASPARKT